MGNADEESHRRRGIAQYFSDVVLYPVRIATTPTLLRAYLRTALIFLTSGILFSFAIVAYTSFYYAYIPVRGISVPVHMQFDPAQADTATEAATQVSATKYPYGLASITGLVSRQKYDVVVEMILPRSDKNLDAGNWMVSLELRGPELAGGGVKGMLGWEEEWEVEDFSQGGESGTAKEAVVGIGSTKEKPFLIARSRRPAILTYRSRITEIAYRMLRLPLYVCDLDHESDELKIQMMEGVDFDRGWRNVPSSLRLELRSRHSLEIYKVTVRFVARLEGLRWIMYTYRLSSFTTGIALFWSVEMCVVLFTWGIFTLLFSSSTSSDGNFATEMGPKAKSENGRKEYELAGSDPGASYSDTSRTFPTLPSQRPLHYVSPPSPNEVKKEEEEEKRLEDVPVREDAEADDEDEDADFILEEPVPNSATGVMTDSGIGTSLESGIESQRGSARRRSGRSMLGDNEEG